MHRTLLCLAALAGVAFLAAWAGQARTADKAAGPAAVAPYVHAVFFRLKKDAPANEAEALIADAQEMLRAIPSVRDLRAGRPAEKSSEKFVQKDYDVGLVLLFDDYEGLKIYLEHPLHLKYVEKHLKHLDTEKLRVFDFINQKK
jgi:hypothetical protein